MYRRGFLSGFRTTLQHSNKVELINNKNYVAIIGMEICNNICASASIFNKGIQIEGSSQHIIIKNCKIHHIENNNTSTSAGANAIGVFGTVAATPVTDILIDSCEIYSNKTGYSEAVSIDGNVDGFKISHCYVHDNNNIGILLSGNYGECKNCINACDASFMPSSNELDLDGKARKSGSAVDIGAYESSSLSTNRSTLHTIDNYQTSNSLLINFHSKCYPHVYLGREHGNPLLLNGRIGEKITLKEPVFGAYLSGQSETK
jgi:hypothetical protein